MSTKKNPLLHFTCLYSVEATKPPHLFLRKVMCVLLQLTEIVKLLMAKMKASAIQRLFA